MAQRTTESNKKKSSAEFLNNPRNAYGLIMITAVLALIIVYLILGSNQTTTVSEPKISSIAPETERKIEVLREILFKDPNDLQSNIELGNLLFDVGDYNSAISYYAHATHLDSLNVEVRIDLAVAYYNLKNFSPAIENMLVALEINPEHIKGLYNIGVMYTHVGDTEKARLYWEKLVRLHPGSEEAMRAEQFLSNMK